MESRPRQPIAPEDILTEPKKRSLSRRTLLKVGALSVASATSLGIVDSLAFLPRRLARAAPATSFPDIQFDIGAFVGPGQTINGIQVNFHPVFTFFSTATLTRNPTKQDQQVLANALSTIEANYAFSPSGIFTYVSYGLPYFNRLPGSLVAANMPRLASDHSRFVLEEAVPSPTDFSPANPRITKQTYNIPVTIESNDVLFTMRSDNLINILEVQAWLEGSDFLNNSFIPSPDFDGLFNFTSARLNFVQPGLPRQVANVANLPFASEINPTSSMWMGFVDQQHDGSAPTAQTVAFIGTNSAHLTTAQPGDYFDNGSIQHLSHDIQDLAQFYSKQGPPADPNGPEPFSERVQYMHRSKKPDGTPGLPFPEDPNDPFTNGGGLGAPTGNTQQQQQSSFIDNFFFGANDQATNFDPDSLAQGIKKYRVGHLAALQRSSRAPDGTPLHIRNDGPGFDSLDVPDGSNQPKLHFTVFVPTAEFFRVMRVNSASLDYVNPNQPGFGGTGTSVPPGITPADGGDDGLERFLTATRRQNFLIPPRRHRAFPLLELT